jgi:hypothetical protein
VLTRTQARSRQVASPGRARACRRATGLSQAPGPGYSGESRRRARRRSDTSESPAPPPHCLADSESPAAAAAFHGIARRAAASFNLKLRHVCCRDYTGHPAQGPPEVRHFGVAGSAAALSGSDSESPAAAAAFYGIARRAAASFNLKLLTDPGRARIGSLGPPPPAATSAAGITDTVTDVPFPHACLWKNTPLLYPCGGAVPKKGPTTISRAAVTVINNVEHVV